METQRSPDFAALARRARSMSDLALLWSARDADEAAEAADKMERLGYKVLKTAGFYRDEAGVYREEVRRRVQGRRF